MSHEYTENSTRRKVNLSVPSGELIAVTGLLEDGDNVAVRGAENLTEGASVKVMMSMSPTTAVKSDG